MDDRSRLKRKQIQQKQTPRPAGERNGIWYVVRKEKRNKHNHTHKEDEEIELDPDS
jgi:hypothetical protein